MGVVVRVRPEARDRLKAVTHVDGTARIQIVDAAVRPWFYDLIREFGELTGVPLLLNTSFNNHSEPIVQTAGEALQCFLTSSLDVLVLGDYVVAKKVAFPDLSGSFRAEICGGVRLIPVGGSGNGGCYYLDAGRRGRITISSQLGGRLAAAPEFGVIGFGSGESLTAEVMQLWQERYVPVCPAG